MTKPPKKTGFDTTQIDQIISTGETQTIEFKSWHKASKKGERINLAVDELVAFANAKGGTLFFGIEDNGQVTGCSGYDCQSIIEAIYDKTRPPLFAEIQELQYNGQTILALSVAHDGNTYATTDGRCLKRLGKNSKPYYPEEMSNRYTPAQSPDFSSQVISDSTLEDVNRLEVYNLKEKLRIRDAQSTLPDMDDMAFLRDLGFLKLDSDIERLTIAGLLFVGKESSIAKLLPQAEVIYLHYSDDNLEEYDARLDMKQPIVTVLDRLTDRIQSENRILNVQVGLYRLEIFDYSEKVFQEALLNALSHRDYQSMGAVYVKQYPNKIVIENPGGFLDGITEKNIITHPSAPRNKLIAETLQRLKYVQRTGQGVDIIYREMISMGKPYPEYHSFGDAVSLTLKSPIDDLAFVKFIVQEQDTRQKAFSLAELMVLRHLTDNRRMKLATARELTQMPIDEVKACCSSLVKHGLIEVTGKEYMLTAKVYNAVKSDVAYTRDRSIQYIKAKSMILEHLALNEYITNEEVQELCGFTRTQAKDTLAKMRKQELIFLVGRGRGAKYTLYS